jgi:hypothetical protein
MGGPEFKGVWTPVVGSGAGYSMEGKQGKMDMEIYVVGKETVADGVGYWLETFMPNMGRGGAMVGKNLMVMTGKEVGIKRMIMQMGNEEPMEFDVNMMQMMGQGQRRTNTEADFREKAELLGKESITTPAGTFECEHWRLKDGSGEVWFTSKVAPYGMVKFVGKDSTMLLTKVITNATSRIKGTPRKFDPSEMMQRPPQ